MTPVRQRHHREHQAMPLPEYVWSKPAAPVEPPDFARQFGFTKELWGLVAGRFPEAASGAEALRRLVEPRLADIANPFDFPGVRSAAEVISAAMDHGGEIVIFGDFDADGVTATAIISSVVGSLGGRVRPFIPFRSEGYGLTDAAVTRCLAGGVPDVLVTVDCGITATESLRRLIDAGARVVVTDHHLPGDAVLPDECVAVAPHFAGVPAPLRHLCGAGVAFTLAAGLVLLRLPEKDSAGISARRALFSWLGALAVATVADVVPLDGENRTIVSLGLKALNSRPSTGLRQLMLATMDSGDIDTRTIGYVIAPHINSAGRMADATLALDLLLADDPDVARNLAVRLKQTNALRKSECARIDAEASAQAESRDIFDPDADGAFVGAADSWHPGVVGLGAARISEKYRRPAALVSFMGGEIGRGSVRAPAGYDVHAALEECSGLLVTFGGHESAAGLSVRRGDLDAFRRAFSAACLRQAGGVSAAPELEIAGRLAVPRIGTGLLDAVARLAPFGEGNQEPVFEIANVAAKASILGRTVPKGLRLAISDDGGATIDGLWFGAQDLLDEFRRQGRWDFAATLLPDDYSGIRSVKLRIVDARPAR